MTVKSCRPRPRPFAIHAALGIDPRKDIYDTTRPVPITDQDTPITELFG